jgi:chromosomal replication initiation ATPase DnaA
MGMSARTAALSVPSVVAKLYGITEQDIECKRGTPHVCKAKCAAAWLMRDIDPSLTLAQIGTILGGKHHTCIIERIRQAVNLLVQDEQFRSVVEQARQQVTNTKQ